MDDIRRFISYAVIDLEDQIYQITHAPIGYLVHSALELRIRKGYG